MSWRDPIDEVYLAKRKSRQRASKEKEKLNQSVSTIPKAATTRSTAALILIAVFGAMVGVIIGYLIGEIRLEAYASMAEAKFAAQETELKNREGIIERYKQVISNLEARIQTM